MIIDARALSSNETLSCDVCIVGAGAAGITIALSFVETGLTVCLLEGGGYDRDPISQSLYAGEAAGQPYENLDTVRSRYFGGSTNCWGGVCRPLDDIDFEHRPWIANSGWPIRRSDIEPFLKESHDLLRLENIEYDIERWHHKIGLAGGPFPLADGDALRTEVGLLSPPARFGQLYRAQLDRAPNVRVLLNANVTEICTNDDASRVVSARVETLTGVKIAVMARATVLAVGGIENARLLLLSNRHQSVGLGNGYDLVGRYFMDHLRFTTAPVKLKAAALRPFYDNTHYLIMRRASRTIPRFVAHLTPSQPYQRLHLMPNSRTYVTASYFQKLADGYNAWKRMVGAISERRRLGVSLTRALADVMAQGPPAVAMLPSVAGCALDFARGWSNPRQSFRLETVMEPVPNPDSRVSLAQTRDRFGRPNALLDWRINDADRRNFARTMSVLHRNAGDVLTFWGSEEPQWPDKVKWCWHHMGTTRMSVDPKTGVVDANGRVHGVANLFVAGSSVFPTAGGDCPTINIVALALRLSKYLVSAGPF